MSPEYARLPPAGLGLGPGRRQSLNRQNYDDQMSAYAIPYTNFQAKNADIREELIAAFASVLDGGRYIMGPEVNAFERDFAGYCESKFAIGVSTGLDALHLVLRCLGIGEGHEVITVSNSFIATAASIALIGARPVFVDITSDFHIYAEKIEADITPWTRAIV